jgi:hypothetical protein
MKIIQLFKDVNLSDINIQNYGRDVLLKFCDMQDGEICGSIHLKNVYILNYHNIFEDKDDGLACYIGEVTIAELQGEEASSKLNVLGFQFEGCDGLTYLPQSSTLFFLHLEGGELAIDLISSNYKLLNE